MRNKIFFIILIFVWLLLVALNLIISKEVFSQEENRYLAKMPKFSFSTLVNGEYVAKLDKYINDNFIFRNEWVKAKSTMEILQGKTESNDVFIGKDGYLFEKFELNNLEIENIHYIINRVNLWSKDIKIPMSFMLIPNSIYINSDKLPNNAPADDQEKIIEKFYSKLDKDIKKINVIDILKENKDKYIFFRTDHHLTSDGAYLVYKKYCEEIGINTTNIENFKRVKVSDSFLGTFDSKAQIQNQKPDDIFVYINDKNTKLKEVIYDGKSDTSIFNKEFLEKKDKYSYFLNTNTAQTVIKTNNKNGKKILLIKDSYAHILAQFFCQDYEEIHFLDPRYYNYPISEYIRDNNVTQVLLLYNVSNIANDLGLRNIR